MQKLSEIVLGKILSYSDNCCAAGVNNSFLIALAKCVDSNPENTLVSRAIALVKVLRYIAVTRKHKLFDVFSKFIDPRLDNRILTCRNAICSSTKVLSLTLSIVSDNRELERKLFDPQYHSGKCLEFDTDIVIPDEIYLSNEYIIESHVSDLNFEDKVISMSILNPLPKIMPNDTEFDTVTDVSFYNSDNPWGDQFEHLGLMRHFRKFQLDKYPYAQYITYNLAKYIGNYDSTGGTKHLVQTFTKAKKYVDTASEPVDENTVISFDTKANAEWFRAYIKKHQNLSKLIQEFEIEHYNTYENRDISESKIKVLHITSDIIYRIQYKHQELEYNKLIPMLGGMFVEEETQIFDILREQYKLEDSDELEQKNDRIELSELVHEDINDDCAGGLMPSGNIDELIQKINERQNQEPPSINFQTIILRQINNGA